MPGASDQKLVPPTRTNENRFRGRPSGDGAIIADLARGRPSVHRTPHLRQARPGSTAASMQKREGNSSTPQRGEVDGVFGKDAAATGYLSGGQRTVTARLKNGMQFFAGIQNSNGRVFHQLSVHTF